MDWKRRIIYPGLNLAIGVVLGATVNAYLQELISVDIVIVNITVSLAFVAILAMAMAYFSMIGDISTSQMKQFNRLAKELYKKAGGTIEYAGDEPEDEVAHGHYRGKFYKKLISEISEARESIYALHIAGIGDSNFKTTDHELRLEYYLTLEDTIRQRKQKFKYERIFQIDRTTNTKKRNTGIERDMDYQLDENGQTTEESSEQAYYENAIGKRMVEHGKNLYSEQKKNISVPLDVSFLELESRSLTGFVIIDKETLLIVTGSIDSNGKPYHSGVFIIKNKPNLVTNYYDRFDRLRRSANEIPRRIFE